MSKAPLGTAVKAVESVYEAVPSIALSTYVSKLLHN